MIGAALAWMRAYARPLALAVFLHAVVGTLLFLSTGLHGANPKDMPGRGSEHEPIQAVTVKESDFKAAQASIRSAQEARAHEVTRLKQQAAEAQRQRKQAEEQLTRLKQQKQSAASEAQAQQQKVASQQQQLQQLNDQAQKLAQQRHQSEAALAKLKQEAAAAEKQRAAEQARLKKIQEQAEQAQKQAAAARKAQMQQQMEAEQQQQLDKARGNWIAAIRNKVTQSWIRPPDTPAGLDCFFKITQLPSGEVTGVDMQKCNGDQAVQESIRTAIYKASPLPTPDDPAVFSRIIVFEFAPDQS